MSPAKMSKATVALIAAVSAGTGALVTAAVMSTSKSNKSSVPSPPIPTPSTPVVPPVPGFVPVPGKPTVAVPPQHAQTVASATGVAPVNPAGLFDYGFPGPVADLATRSTLISSYDRRTRNPHWVAEHITSASLAQKVGDRQQSNFLEDESIPEKFRGLLKDYFRSGYDRGHQVPAADCKWSQTAMDETFYLSNMCPQVGDGFNRDYWSHFEDFCRRLTKKYPSVRIATGPLYLPKQDPNDKKWYVKYEVIGNPPSIAVPTHFYKVIFAEDGKQGGNVALGAFVMPNAVIPNETPLTQFEVPIEVVERASGLEFAAKLPNERRKRLCAETSCSVTIRDFAQKQKAFEKK